jgi:hypothetical protein
MLYVALLKFEDASRKLYNFCDICTDKKENKIFLTYREIKMGSGAQSYMRKGFLIYKEMHKYFHHI